jgi:hypothetical protein
METALVLLVALTIMIALALALRRHGRLNPRGTKGGENERRAESWLTRGGGRG